MKTANEKPDTKKITAILCCIYSHHHHILMEVLDFWIYYLNFLGV